MMKTYIGTKQLMAVAMTLSAYNAYRQWDLPEGEDGAAEGYLVEYLDGGKPNHPDHLGYISWSPKEVFEQSYRQVDGMSFGLALESAQKGHRIARHGWNGKGLWVEYVPPVGDGRRLGHMVLHYPVGSEAYPDGAVVPWTPSQTDMLACDWAACPVDVAYMVQPSTP